MQLRRLGLVLSSALVAVSALAGALPANAVVLEAIYWDEPADTVNPSALPTAAVGDTFDVLQTIGASGGWIVDGSGSGTVDGRSCVEAASFYLSACAINFGVATTVTVTSLGTMRIINALGETSATITLGPSSTPAPSAGGGSAPVLVASQPPTVSASPGNGLVQLSITPGTGGTGTALGYQIQIRDGSGSLVTSTPATSTGQFFVADSPTGTTTVAIPGLQNGTAYTFGVKEVTSDLMWSGERTATATPDASITCSTLSVDVAQPGGQGTDTVTSPVSSAAPAVYPFIAPPYGGTVRQSAMGAWAPSTQTGAAGGEYATFTPSTDKPCSVTVTAPDGLRLSTSTGVAWNAGSSSLTAYSGTPVYVFGTKTGDYDVSFTAGPSLSAKPKVKIGTVSEAAYAIALAPASQTLTVGARGTATVSVTDAFGNPVHGAGVRAYAEGTVVTTDGSWTDGVTNAAGALAIQLAALGAGSGTVNAAPAPGTKAWAWQTGYAKPTGFADPVSAATSAVTVAAAKPAASIVITGTRTSVSGKPGIQIDGVAEGITAGDVVVPYFRFPGETSFTPGTARPVIDASGAFVWQRKTGKKFYAYVTNGDGTVKSNTVIIPAR